MKKKTSINGQALIEMLIALAVVMVVVLALLAVTTSAIRNASFARNQAQATRYAQEAIESARQQRDTEPEGVFFIGGSCDSTDNLGIFTRTRTCSLNVTGPTKIMTVIVIVSWTDSQRTHQSEMTTHLSNWQ